MKALSNKEINTLIEIVERLHKVNMDQWADFSCCKTKFICFICQKWVKASPVLISNGQPQDLVLHGKEHIEKYKTWL